MPDHPALLLPVRLETRFGADELRVRIYPDQIGIESHTLPDSASVELEQTHKVCALPDYFVVYVYKTVKARSLRSRFGARAPGGGHLSAKDLSSDRASPQISLRSLLAPMPAKNVEFLLFKRAAKAIVGDLPMLADPAESDSEGDNYSKWLVDFDEAVNRGLALTIRLLGEAGPFSRVIAVGVRADQKKGTQVTAALFENHVANARLSFLAYGTPTNNTEEARAGSKEHIHVADQKIAPNRPTNATRLAKALGLDATLLGQIPGANDISGDAHAFEAQTALWWGMGGYFLSTLMSGSLSEEAIGALGDHFSKYVRARGPLPAIMISTAWDEAHDERVARTPASRDAVPYGILPVTQLIKWKPSPKDISPQQLTEAFPAVLDALRAEWLLLAENPQHVPRIGASDQFGDDLTRVLMMSARSQEYALYPMVDDRTIAAQSVHSNQLLSLLRQRKAAEVIEKLHNEWQSVQLKGSEFLYRLARAAGLNAPDNKTPILLTFILGAERSVPLDGETSPWLAQDKDTPLGISRTAYLGALADNNVDLSSSSKTILAEYIKHALFQCGSKSSAGSANAASLSSIRGHIRSLSELPEQVVEDIFRDVLDLHSHRLDAWITSLAFKRLEGMRARSATGIHIGAYGWVEDLERASATTRRQGGFIHAPSVDQATCAAVLRNAEISHNPDIGAAELADHPFCINLTSERVRRGLDLLNRVRTSRHQAVFRGGLGDVDAAADLLMQESVSAAIQGRYELSGAALSATSGDGLPPDIESMSTPSSGVALSHRLCMIFDQAPTPTGPNTPRAIAEPRLNGWFGRMLGATDKISCRYRWSAGGMLKEGYVTLSEILNEIAAIDFLYLAGSATPRTYGESSDASRPDGLTQIIEYCVRRLANTAVGAGLPITVDLETARSADHRSIEEAAELSRYVLSLISGGEAYLTNGKILPIGDVAPVTTLQQEVKTHEDLRRRLLSCLSAAWRNNPLTRLLLNCSADELNDRAIDFDAAVATSDVAAKEKKQESVFARNKANQLESAGKASEAYEQSQKAEAIEREAISLYIAAIDTLIDAAKRLFGKNFAVLPIFDADVFSQSQRDQRKLVPAGEQRIALWLQQLAQTHLAVRRLEDVLMLSEAWQGGVGSESPQRMTLRVFQYCHDPDLGWLALSRDELTAGLSPAEVESKLSDLDDASGVVSVVVWAPSTFQGDQTAPLAGLLIDQWDEFIPKRNVTTGLSFQYDQPNAQAPQSILLAVPAEWNEGSQWRTDDLADIIKDTMDLAKVRTVDIDAITDAGRIFPALFLPTDVTKPNWQREIPAQGMEDFIRDLMDQAK